MVQYLKRFLFVLAVLVVSLHLGAQDPEYFIYLQSERSQPFYVRYEGKVLSSSDKGYLIISKVHAGTASLRIGFANGSGPEQQFLVKMSGTNDQGYLIKKDGDEGYALYNLQTFAAIRPSKGVPKESVTVTAAVVVKDTVVAEALPPAPVAGDSSMMTSLKKDLDSTFTNTSDVTVGPGSRPVNTIAPPVAVPVPVPVTPPAAKPQGNMFSNALDKVVGDDRVEEVPPPADDIVVVDSAVATTTDAAPVAAKKPRKRRRDALTPEEQKLAADVIAEEHLAEATADALAFDSTVAPVEKKSRRHAAKKEDEPAFINFGEDSTKQAAGIAAPDPVVAPAEEAPVPSKKKKHKTETPENIVADSTGYAISDLSIDHPKESKRERRKKKEAEDAGMIPAIVPTELPAAAPVAEPVEEKKAAVKMINSDCGNVLDETNFRKVLRKFVAGKDDDGMIDAFRRQTKGYCLETSQIKTLVQLLGTNESRYRLLDLAYPKVSDSEHYSSLENVLTDDYYKGRFKAMLHK
jgi:hypothetical protein